jgi:hypothetical protein
MTDLTDDLTPAELRCGIALQLREIERLQARVTHLEQLITDAVYTLSKARVWNGHGWTYNPLHPVIYTQTRERLAAEADLIYAAREPK